MTSMQAIAGRVQREVFRSYQAEREALAEEYRKAAGEEPGAAMIVFGERGEALAARYADRIVDEVATALRLNRRARRAAARDLDGIRAAAFQKFLPGGMTAADVAAQVAAGEAIDTDFTESLTAILEAPE